MIGFTLMYIFFKRKISDENIAKFKRQISVGINVFFKKWARKFKLF